MNRLKRGAVFGALALACGLVVASTGAARNAPEPTGLGDGLIQPAVMPLGLSNKPSTVMLELKGDPVTVAKAEGGLSKGQEKALKDQLKANQNALKGSIEKLGAKVLADYQLAYNGIKVHATARQVAALAQLPGVVGVRQLQKMELTNVRGVPLIGAPDLWHGVAGLHGEGIKIAVIDTGIDFTHANFGGPGTIGAYQAENAKDTLPPAPTLMGPLAPRVKGGIDLVGDAYNASAPDGSPALIPHPDPNPLDCNGHGSHVAGTAAGSGVLANGSTYNGSYDANTINANNWTIAPGVAPKAELYGIRVFGCAGSTDVTVDAIEWAVENGMHVINMSLGSPFGSKDDPSAVASTNAAKAGVIVVTSAGNSSASQYITGSPGTADGSIATAANDAWATTPGATLTVTPTITGSPFTLINANGYDFTGPVNGTIVVLQDNPATTTDQAGFLGSADESLGCSPTAYTWNGVVPGGNQIAVVNRGSCARVAKPIFGQQAGAAVVIQVNNAAGLPPFEGKITSNPDTGIPFEVTIPYLGVGGPFSSATSPGGRLRAAGGGKAGSIVETDLTNTNYKGFASFSSGGPRTGDSFLKPDITAPGVSVISTGNGTGNGLAIISGTSMASPHAAGSAALVRQAHMSWTVEHIKAAIINTGEPGGVTGLAGHRISRGGTGLIQPARAAATQVVAHASGGAGFNTPGRGSFQVALSYGFEELKNDFTKTKSIKLRNFSGSAATFNVSQELPSGSPHTVSFNKTSVTVPAGGSADVEVTLSVAAATVGGALNFDTFAMLFREVVGMVKFTPASANDNRGVALRVPYYLVPRALSEVETELSGKLLPGTTTATVSNKAGAPIAGSADFHAWGLEDKKDKGKVPNDVRAIGVQSFPSPTAAAPTRRLLVFTVNTWDRWSNAAMNEFDIYVDVDPQNNNGDDYIVVGADLGAIQTGTFNGQMAAFVFSTRSAGAAVNFLATAPTDSTVAQLPVLTSTMCRTNEPCLSQAASPRLTYNAVSFDVKEVGDPDVVDGIGHYNPWNEAITTGGFAVVAPGASDSSNDVTINAAEWANTPAKGLMIVTFDNKNGKEEAQLIEVGKKK